MNTCYWNSQKQYVHDYTFYSLISLTNLWLKVNVICISLDKRVYFNINVIKPNVFSVGLH